MSCPLALSPSFNNRAMIWFKREEVMPAVAGLPAAAHSPSHRAAVRLETARNPRMLDEPGGNGPQKNARNGRADPGFPAAPQISTGTLA
jgi:hypothetical protein